MSFMKRLLAVLLGCATALTVVGCATPTGPDNPPEEEVNRDKTQLYVFNYGGGFGREWLDAAKQRFEALHADDVYEKGKKGVQIIIDHRKESLTSEQYKTSTNEVFFTEGVNFYNLYNGDTFLDITDAVTEPLSDIDADDTQSIEDKMYAEQRDFFGVTENGETKYYAVPHYSGFYGIMYDIDLFENNKYYFAKDQSLYEESGLLEDKFISNMNTTRSAGPDGTEGTYDDGLPATYEEFFELCDYIASTSVMPIRWTGANYRDYLNQIMFALMADYEGKDNLMVNFTFDGSTVDNLGTLSGTDFVYDAQATDIDESNGYELYRSDSRYYALKFLEQLCIDDNDHNKYHTDPVTQLDLAFNSGFSHMDAQEYFLQGGYDQGIGRAAMLIDGNWWQMEAANTFESMADFYGDELSAENRNIGIMPLPKANEQKVQEGKESGVRQTIVDTQYSVAFIKSTIDEYKIDLAKEFLRFVNTQESLVEYTTITNTPKALDYSLSETEMAQLSPYGRSTFTLLADSEIVYPYSKDPLYLNNVSFFRVLNMFNSYVGSTHYQWPAEAFRDYGITAEQYFTGMRSYYTEERWNQLT